MRRSFKKQRGAASVETAISMIVFIPVFMYALFLDDLLRYAADLQEAVTSTPWDFTIQDYNQPGKLGLANAPGTAPVAGGTAVQKNARLMFCDHESSGDSYNQSTDCDGLNHHVGRALSGHVCWLNDKAEQIACENPRTNVGDFGDSTFGGYKGAFGNTGGLFECHGQEIVENYLMPKTFLQSFSKVDMSKENWKSKGGDIHGNAQAGDDSTAYYLEKVHFSVVADPWALNDRNLAKPAGSTDGPVWDRVNNVYTGNPAGTIAINLARAYMLETVSQQLLINPTQDDPGTPRISFPSGAPPSVSVTGDSGSGGYFSAPWRDSAYQNTYNNRGDNYMGCTSPESC